MFVRGEFDPSAEAVQPFVFASQHHKGSAAFVHVNLEGQTGQEFADYFGIEEENTLMGISPVGVEDIENYRFTGAWDNEDVRVWVQALLDDKLERHYKSEEPYPEVGNPIKQIVGSEYEQIVHKPNTHVLVEFYAPWCHHCKKVRLQRN